MNSPDVLAEVRAAIKALDDACARAIESIDAESPDAAFAASDELAILLGDLQRKLNRAVSEVRTRSVGRIWDAERLSLAGLASRIGVSKGRADQLIRSAKKQWQSEGETDDDD